MSRQNGDRASGGRVTLVVNGMNEPLWRAEVEKRREVVPLEQAYGDPSVHYALAWKPQPGQLANLPGLKAIFSLGAGVDHLITDTTLPDVPLVRVVEENLTGHMCDYVCWRVLDHHRQGRLYREQQAAGVWHHHDQPAANTISVGIMGFGALGQAAASRLMAFGYRVAGWSRSPRRLPGAESFHGEDGLASFLARTDILVALLPHTQETEGIIDYDLLAGLRRDGPLGGPVLINGGRGKLQKEADILRALEDGVLREASLDVFETEPLPASSPLWTHPRIFITPHAAAPSDPAYLVPPMLDQMDAQDRGEPLGNLVDRQRGY